MQDAETKTLWNHITGEAVYGPLVGRNVGPMSNLLHMTVKQALAMDPAMRVAISERMYFAGGRRFGTPSSVPIVGMPGGGRGRGSRPAPSAPGATMNERFAATIAKEDTRRPRMEIGLGVWTDRTRRYYPIDRIRERGEVFIDRIDGRSMLVYVEAGSNAPAAVFVSAKTAARDGEDIVLDDGSRIRSGMLVGRDGGRQALERPQQMFTRWYGFALTFPGCEVFGE